MEVDGVWAQRTFSAGTQALCRWGEGVLECLTGGNDGASHIAATAVDPIDAHHAFTAVVEAMWDASRHPGGLADLEVEKMSSLIWATASPSRSARTLRSCGCAGEGRCRASWSGRW